MSIRLDRLELQVTAMMKMDSRLSFEDGGGSDFDLARRGESYETRKRNWRTAKESFYRSASKSPDEAIAWARTNIRLMGGPAVMRVLRETLGLETATHIMKIAERE